ncbi:zinc ribbon domain-containing protein [Companilactobacillus formosensis]|jgi:hypothetical protein|uniref:zinc ribbon domain-containing protein n=1 Tax=Companilactobacillus formosensis TaxID=1617889 RepID=UPI000E6578D1|nr:zinc-ribbon domain-containing protein [Companilactobacillus formosensis]
MFCPNCGHKVDPDQKFCDNCGYALKKKKTETTNQVKDDDTIRSLSDIENELNQEDKSEKEPEAPLQQAPAQQKEYGSFDHPKVQRPDPEPEMKTYNKTNDSTSRPSSFAKSSADEPLDDKTQVYSKNDFNPISQKPYKKTQEHETDYHSFEDPIKDPIKDPFAPTENERRAAEAKRKAEQTDPNDGFIHNMVKFAKNNAYISIFAVIITAILLVVKRNYGYIALAIVIILWFLLSQLRHGNEVGANKALKHETSFNKDSNNEHPDTTAQTTHQAHQQKPKYETAADRLKPNHKTTAQKTIIVASLIGFIASIGGPFLDGFSLSATITSAASRTSAYVAQPVWITNGVSAIRLICFLSPVIALIAACFRSRGTIRLVRLFTFLPSILYAALYVVINFGYVNSSMITGQVVASTGKSLGTSFYVLLITSVISLIMAYTLRPKVKM